MSQADALAGAETVRLKVKLDGEDVRRIRIAANALHSWEMLQAELVDVLDLRVLSNMHLETPEGVKVDSEASLDTYRSQLQERGERDPLLRFSLHLGTSEIDKKLLTSPLSESSQSSTGMVGDEEQETAVAETTGASGAVSDPFHTEPLDDNEEENEEKAKRVMEDLQAAILREHVERQRYERLMQAQTNAVKFAQQAEEDAKEAQAALMEAQLQDMVASVMVVRADEAQERLASLQRKAAEAEAMASEAAAQAHKARKKLQAMQLESGKSFSQDTVERVTKVMMDKLEQINLELETAGLQVEESESVVVQDVPEEWIEHSMRFSKANLEPQPEPQEHHGYDMRFVTDVTFPDGQEVDAFSEFVKMWRVRNVGDKAWDESVTLRHSSGALLGSKSDARYPVPAAEPGEEVLLQVDMKAPAKMDNHVSFWHLCDPNGEPFGDQLYVHIAVLGSHYSLQVPDVDPETGDVPDLQTSMILLRKDLAQIQ